MNEVAGSRKGIIYVRATDVCELGSAIAACREWCETNSVAVRGILVELGSATESKRPVLREALDALGKGVADTLVTRTNSELWDSSTARGRVWAERILRVQDTVGFELAEIAPEAIEIPEEFISRASSFTPFAGSRRERVRVQGRSAVLV